MTRPRWLSLAENRPLRFCLIDKCASNLSDVFQIKARSHIRHDRIPAIPARCRHRLVFVLVPPSTETTESIPFAASSASAPSAVRQPVYKKPHN
jgi:hypothetical protein